MSVFFRGKHDRQPEQCRNTWGTCDVRSNDKEANPNEKILPHICGNIGEHLHCECMACPTSQV
jgi:hypothetical protein